MLTAQYTGEGAMTVARATTDAPSPGHVQIEVAFVGLCGTDLHILHGHMDQRVDMPAIIGHEMSGAICAVGPDVVGWAVGQPVTVMPLDWDGTCPACLAGHTHICQNLNFIGIDSPGALQGRWNVPVEILVGLPLGLRLDYAALAEPCAVAVHDVRRSELGKGDRVVVIGGGPIGVLIASVAKNKGADVRLVEVQPERRALAAELGFEVIDPAASDQVEAIESWTDGAGADVVFEVSGAASAVLGATALAKVRGTIVVVAIHPEPRPLDLQRVFWRELRILGARVYERADFEEAVELLAGEQIPADRLISHIEPLSDVARAFAALEDGSAMKVLIDVQQES